METIDYAVFILTNGRPSNVLTYNALKKAGYTGRIYIIIDNQDKKANAYKERFGNQVIVFDKEDIASQTDTHDNFGNMKAIVYARNASYKIAENLGLKYFIQLDDDYTDFRYKFNDRGDYGDWTIKNIDNIFQAIFQYYAQTPARCIAIAQGGDFIGGKNSKKASELTPLRKCMNTFFCSTERPVRFRGTMNEDVTTYTTCGSRGGIFMTITNTAINQKQTQSLEGGMTDTYKDGGTYLKTFYTILSQPSSVKVSVMRSKYTRIHHEVRWNNTVPLILSEDIKKQ